MISFETDFHKDFMKDLVYVFADAPNARVRCGTSRKYMDDLKGVEDSWPYCLEIFEELKPEFCRRIEARQFEPGDPLTVLILSSNR